MVSIRMDSEMTLSLWKKNDNEELGARLFNSFPGTQGMPLFAADDEDDVEDEDLDDADLEDDDLDDLDAEGGEDDEDLEDEDDEDLDDDDEEDVEDEEA